MPSDLKQKPTAEEVARGWARLRQQAAVLLMFSGVVPLFCLFLDWVSHTQRVIRPVLALILGPALIAAGYLLDRTALGSLFRRPEPSAPNPEPGPAPEPTPEIKRESVASLWVVMIFPAVFGGMFASVPLTGTSTEGGPWGVVLVMLVVVGFFTVAGLFLGIPRLEELRHRGAWVPPGTEWSPALVAIGLTLLTMTATGAAMLTVGWLVQLAWPAS